MFKLHEKRIWSAILSLKCIFLLLLLVSYHSIDPIEFHDSHNSFDDTFINPLIQGLDSSIRFLAIGDWGGIPDYPFTTESQIANAYGMNLISEFNHAQFIVSVGDNFYSDGITDIHDPRFDLSWKKVYLTKPYLQIPWYIIAGNHDYSGNLSAQIDYSHHSSYWNFPSNYYRRTYHSKDHHVSLDILYLDTIAYTGYRDGLTFPSEIQDYTQHEWLKQQLQQSTADYIIVVGHYAIYSSCAYGNFQALQTYLEPLLNQYQASYLAGHEHCINHHIINQTHHWLNGIGLNCCYPSKYLHQTPMNTLKYSLMKNGTKKELNGLNGIKSGFTSFIVNSNELIVTFHNQNGDELYTSYVQPRSLSPRYRNRHRRMGERMINEERLMDSSGIEKDYGIGTELGTGNLRFDRVGSVGMTENEIL